MMEKQEVAGENEVEVTQFIAPNGRKRLVFAEVGAEVKEMAKGMRLSSEVLGTGKVALYARWDGEKEEAESVEIADNGPGENSPRAVLTRLITRKYLERRKKR